MFSSLISSLNLHNRKRPHRTPRSVQDLERRGDKHSAGRWKQLQIAKVRESELTTAVHEVMVRERWREARRLAGVRADGFHSHAEHIALRGQELRTFGGPSRRMRTVLADVEII